MHCIYIYYLSCLLAPNGAAFDPFNQGSKGPAPPLEKKADDR